MKSETLQKALLAISKGATCKREVQALSGLSWGAVSQTINLLLERSVITDRREDAAELTGAGRKSSYFEFNRRDFLCLGMELQQWQINTALLSLDGQMIGQSTHELDAELGPDSLFCDIRSAFAAQVRQVSLKPENVVALAFALIGAVDKGRRIWRQSPHIPLIRDCSFAELRDDFPNIRYLSVEHDIFSKGRAALATNAWQDENYAFFHLGDGISIAVHNHDGFFFGSRGFAGEIGHIPSHDYLSPDAPPRLCRCGQTNCLETFLSARGALAFARQQLGIEAVTISELYTRCSPQQMEQLGAYLKPYLLHAAVTVVNLFDPETLILGGELVEPWLSVLEERFLQEMQERSWQHSPDRLRCFRLADCDSAFGAALGAIAPTLDLISQDHAPNAEG